MSLIRIKQRNDESLRKQISRFNLEALEITYLSIAFTIQLLVKGLKERPLQLSLLKKKSKDKKVFLAKFKNTTTLKRH